MKTNKVIHTYESIQQASKSFGKENNKPYCYAAIVAALSIKGRSAYGYYWEYIN